MGFFNKLFDELAEIGQECAIQHEHNQLKQLVGTFGYAGMDYDSEYAIEHGETPAETKLRKFEEGKLKDFYNKDRYKN